MKTTTLSILLTVTLCFAISLLQAQVAINTDGSAAHSSAMLDVKSTAKGLLIPRMTTAQRITLGAGATAGLFVFDTDQGKFYYHNGSAWQLGDAGSLWQSSGFYVYLSDPGNYVGIGTNAPERNLHVHGEWETMRLSTSDSGPTLEFVGSATIDWGLSAWNDGFYIISSNNDFEGRTEQFYMNTIMFGPVTPNSKSLGAGTVRWSNVFSVDANFTGILNGNNAILQGYLGVGTPVPARTFEAYGPYRTARISSMDQGASLEFVSASNPDWNIATWFGDLHLSTSTDDFTTNAGQFIFTPDEFRPFGHNNKNLGSQYASWNHLYAYDGYFSNELNAQDGYFFNKLGVGTDDPARALEVTGGWRTARISSESSGASLELVSSSSPDWGIAEWQGTFRLISSDNEFISSTDEYWFAQGYFRPYSHGTKSLGTSNAAWRELYSGDGFFTGNLGAGTQTPLGKLHVHDAGKRNAKVYITPKSTSSNDSATIILAGDANAIYGMYWMYDGNGTEMELWGKAGTAHYGPHISVNRNSGNVAIGNIYANGYKLSVGGKVICTEVRVEAVSSWPDYVFNHDYDLMSLREVEQWIRENKHLPGIPSAAEVEAAGFDLGDMQKKLLEKLEELTLYVIEQEKKIERLEAKLADHENHNHKIKNGREVK